MEHGNPRYAGLVNSGNYIEMINIKSSIHSNRKKYNPEKLQLALPIYICDKTQLVHWVVNS